MAVVLRCSSVLLPPSSGHIRRKTLLSGQQMYSLNFLQVIIKIDNYFFHFVLDNYCNSASYCFLWLCLDVIAFACLLYVQQQLCLDVNSVLLKLNKVLLPSITVRNHLDLLQQDYIKLRPMCLVDHMPKCFDTLLERVSLTSGTMVSHPHDILY